MAETTVLTRATRMYIVDALDAATAAAAEWRLDTLTFPEVAARLAAAYRVARRHIPENWSQADAEDLHELRKRVVIHRYQMETVQPLWPRFAKMWIGEMQRLRDRLGRHQDLLVLEDLTRPDQPLAAWRPRLTSAIKQRKEQHAAAARRIAARLFVDKPAVFRRRLEVLWESGS